MSSLIEIAKALFERGWTVEEVRTELRGTVLACGDFPTCSSVEDAIRAAQS